jgi:voltage-gated sodium channel
VLLEGMLDSVKSMIWVGALLTVIIYTFAIFCILVLGDSLEESTGQNYFGDIPHAMLSLFNMALLTDWSNVIWPVYETHPAVTLVLILFIVVTSLGVLNVIIGLIVERTNAAAEKMSGEDRELERRMQLDAVVQLTKMMCELDANHDGWLSLDEMGSAIDNPKFTDMMKQINLPLGFGLRDLYLMLDTDMNSKVTTKEFVEGMYRFVHCNEFQRTCLSHLSIAQVKRQINQAQKQMKQDVQRLRQEQQDLAQEMRQGLSDVMQAIANLQRAA